jgi:hypothetical protein
MSSSRGGRRSSTYVLFRGRKHRRLSLFSRCSGIGNVLTLALPGPPKFENRGPDGTGRQARGARRYLAGRRRWSVISGGQLNLTGTIEVPAPTDV